VAGREKSQEVAITFLLPGAESRDPIAAMKAPFRPCELTLPFFVLFLASLASLGFAEPNQLSSEDKAAGWLLLFNGRDLKGWHAPGKTTGPAEKWDVQDGWLHCLGKGGGDMVTDEQFEEFELEWEWRLAAAGNSGLKYFVAAFREPLGHEYQMLDDNAHPDAKLGDGKRVTASFYDVFGPQVKTPLNKPGEINFSRVLIKGNHVEHWLNKVKVLEYECGSEATKKAVQDSKFKTTMKFGERVPGRILLQDHNSEVWVRNLRIRPAKP